MTIIPLPDEADTDPGETGVGSRRRHRVRNALIGLLVCTTVLSAVAGGAVLYLEHRLSSHITRIGGVFEGLPDRPRKPPSGRPGAEAVNILLLGTDRRSPVATTGRDAQAAEWVPGAQRSDTILIVHIDGDRRGASVISIPRDSWVQVPGYGPAKVNAAFSYAGPSLAVATIERLTGLRIDHLAVVDWAGFIALTDKVGGVTVTVPQTVNDSARGVTWTAGEHTLRGKEALLYVRQRYGLPGGDLDRVRRQQSFLRLLLETSLTQEMIVDPHRLYSFLDTVTRHLSVDAGWSTEEMASLVMSLRHLRSADIRYLTVPVAGTGWVGDQSVVRLDERLGHELWAAVREDRLDTWLQGHPGLETPQTVN